MQRVVHIVEDMKIGGQERVIEDILNNLDKNLFESQLLCLTNGGIIADRIKKNGIKVTILYIKNYNSIFAIKKVMNWLKNEKIDIVHTHGFSAGVLGRVSAYFANIEKIYAHIHTMSDDLSIKHSLKEKILSFMTTKVITVSRSVTNSYLKKTNISPQKISMIYNGLSLPLNRTFEDETLIKKRYDIPENAKIAGNVASLTIHKAHKILLKAIKNVENIYLLIVGDGPEKMELARFSVEIGIEKRVRFVGNQEDIFPFINIMDIFILSSTREGHPLSIIEAMGFKKPVIATDVGGVSEIVEDGLNGFIVKKNSSDEIEKSLKILINNKKLCEKFGNNGREIYINKFTLADSMEKISKLYGE